MKNILLAYTIRTQISETIAEYSDAFQVFLADEYENPIHKADSRLAQVESILSEKQSIYTWNICEIINSSDY